MEPARLAAASAGRTRRSWLSPAPVAESAAPEPNLPAAAAARAASAPAAAVAAASAGA
ncbi:MAG: peptigoglycan-binding protein LysM, partial [Candidatus Rokuibacteriota bacterium]